MHCTHMDDDDNHSLLSGKKGRESSLGWRKESSPCLVGEERARILWELLLQGEIAEEKVLSQPSSTARSQLCPWSFHSSSLVLQADCGSSSSSTDYLFPPLSPLQGESTKVGETEEKLT